MTLAEQTTLLKSAVLVYIQDNERIILAGALARAILPELHLRWPPRQWVSFGRQEQGSVVLDGSLPPGSLLRRSPILYQQTHLATVSLVHALYH